MHHLSSKNFVVYTYTAVCMERILAMKGGPNGGPLFQAVDVSSTAESTFKQLFDLIESNGSNPSKLSENDYLMKAIMRLVLVLGQQVSPYLETILSRLTKIIQVISKTPSNPKFNHFAFETMACLVRYEYSRSKTIGVST